RKQYREQHPKPPGNDLDDAYTYLDPPEEPADWWASTESFFGESATNVQLHEVGFDATHAEPGKAGRAAKSAAWWASSICHGEPAVHTLTIGFPYRIGATAHFEPVFRAYVQDVAKRRGCTDVKFPAASDFSRD